MPKITIQGKIIDCAKGANLRQVLGDITVSKYDKFWGQRETKIW